VPLEPRQKEINILTVVIVVCWTISIIFKLIAPILYIEVDTNALVSLDTIATMVFSYYFTRWNSTRR
jgi:hypothetical protein